MGFPVAVWNTEELMLERHHAFVLGEGKHFSTQLRRLRCELQPVTGLLEMTACQVGVTFV